jgi:hypothetical protein
MLIGRPPLAIYTQAITSIHMQYSIIKVVGTPLTILFIRTCDLRAMPFSSQASISFKKFASPETKVNLFILFVRGKALTERLLL